MDSENEPLNPRRVAAQARLRTLRAAYDLAPSLRLKGERPGWAHLVPLADNLDEAVEALMDAEREADAGIDLGIPNPEEDDFLRRMVGRLDSVAEQAEAALADG